VLLETSRQEDGGLVTRLTWKEEVLTHLGRKFSLERTILHSQKKLPADKLSAMDRSIAEWEEAGYAQRVVNLREFQQTYPRHSFLAEMGVFRPDPDAEIWGRRLLFE